MLLNADPEGFVPGTVPGLAVAANVSLDEARGAIALFLHPDPDSNSQEHEGRRIEKVPHGWRILNFVYWRLLSKHEAEKARKRNWAHQKRSGAANDNEGAARPMEQLTLPGVDMSTGVDASSETLDAPKPKPKPEPKEEEESPLPPEALDEARLERWREHALPIAGELFVHTHHTLDGLDETGLEDEAAMAGVSREWFRERLASARNIRIGGASGVRDQREWVRQQFGKWKTWWEEHQAKNAQRSAASAPSRGFAGAPARLEPFEPLPKQAAFASKHGLDLSALLHGVLADYPQTVPSFSRLAELSERLTVAAKQKRAGHPVTGKLTRAEAVEWGAVPAGGAVPEVA
jgi:hypothetical protein